jgi:hypothetical protein
VYKGEKIQMLNLSKDNNDDANSLLQNAMMSGASTYITSQVQSELLIYLNFEDRLPKIFLEIEAYLQWREAGEKVTIKGLNDLIETADIIIELINKELEK